MKSSEVKYQQAAKRVKELKGFYRHLRIFFIVNLCFYLLKSGVLNSLMPEWYPVESYYFDWVNINVVIWGVILIIHAIILNRHKLPFLKNWEKKQIQKFMDKDKEETEKYR